MNKKCIEAITNVACKNSVAMLVKMIRKAYIKSANNITFVECDKVVHPTGPEYKCEMPSDEPSERAKNTNAFGQTTKRLLMAIAVILVIVLVIALVVYRHRIFLWPGRMILKRLAKHSFVSENSWNPFRKMGTKAFEVPLYVKLLAYVSNTLWWAVMMACFALCIFMYPKNT
jgi:hypothetical protein